MSRGSCWSYGPLRPRATHVPYIQAAERGRTAGGECGQTERAGRLRVGAGAETQPVDVHLDERQTGLFVNLATQVAVGPVRADEAGEVAQQDPGQAADDVPVADEGPPLPPAAPPPAALTPPEPAPITNRSKS